MLNSAVSVLATYTDDILINEQGKVLASQPGGPALFIKKALSSENVAYQDFEKEKLTVKILLTDAGEFGKVPIKPKITSMDTIPLTQWMVVSTVLGEWDITSLKNFPEKLFVDLQGYVRDGDDFGKKRGWDEVGKFYKNVYCIIGTREEISYLPQDVVEDQKANRMLVMNDGAKGTAIYDRGVCHRIPTQPIAGLKDTIGAGDTFLGYFTASLYKGMDTASAGHYATEKTRLFLLGKLDNY